jgi:hypothetical protein
MPADENTPADSSLDAIAASLIVSDTENSAETSDPQVTTNEDSAPPEQGSEGPASAEEIEATAAEEAEPAEVDILADEDSDEDADQSDDLERADDFLDEDDGFDPAELSDDQLVSVTVDGVKAEVTLEELKQRYAGGETVAKRVQEATEARNATVEHLNETRQLAETLVTQFGESLFRRTIPAPDPKMLDTSPNEYMRQKVLFDQEGEMLAAHHQQLSATMEQLTAQQQALRAEQRVEAAKELRRILPAIANPEKAPVVKKAISEAAEYFGFTPQDVASCSDARIFKALAFASAELRRRQGVSVVPKSVKTTTLASAPAKKRNPGSSASRKHAAAMKQAAKTGKVDDIAASLIMPAPKRRRA